MFITSNLSLYKLGLFGCCSIAFDKHKYAILDIVCNVSMSFES